MTFRDRCLQETVRLHDFLKAWLVGALERTPEAFAAFETAPADPCSVVSPLGTRTEREALVVEFEGLHGVLAADRGRFAVRARNIRDEALFGDHAVLTYEEWHEHGEDWLGAVDDRADARGALGAARDRLGPHPRDLAARARAHGGGALPRVRGARRPPPTAVDISASTPSIARKSPAPATMARARRRSSRMSAIILLDGGMGQKLVARSAQPAGPLWSAKVMMHEPEITAAHRDFLAEGAPVTTLNACSATPERLARVLGLAEAEHRFEALQHRAIELARAAVADAPYQAAVAG